jgi:hypothetical protein
LLKKFTKLKLILINFNRSISQIFIKFFLRKNFSMSCHFPAVNAAPFFFFLLFIFVLFAFNQSFFLIRFFFDFRLGRFHKVRERHNSGCILARIQTILSVIFCLRTTRTAFLNILCFVGFFARKPLISCPVRHVVWNMSIEKNWW